MAKVVMYSTATCPYCVRADQLLAKKGITAEKIRIDLDPSKRDEMVRLTNRRTVPQIFIGETHIGGFDDMAALDAAGKLDALLAAN